MQNSGLAYNFKDLEKTIPSVASINGMLVKDYLQALQDDDKIKVEKIGSVNWYWSFPGDDKKRKEAELQKVESERDKAAAAVADLRQKVEVATSARVEDDETALARRQELVGRQAELRQKIDGAGQQLSRYRDSDPVEMEKSRARIASLRADAELLTDHILNMESWFKEQSGGEREAMNGMRRTFYGDEFDEEEQGLRELPPA